MPETFFSIQIISVLFALFMIYLIRVHHKRGNLGFKEYASWMSCWIAFIIFALVPQLLTPVINRLKIIRVLDLLMVIAFMILTFIAFTDHMAIRDLYRQIGQLVSKKARTKAKRNF